MRKSEEAAGKLVIIEEECPRIPRRGWREIRNIRPGKDVSVIFKDGRIINGSFSGIKTVPEYAKIYSKSRERAKDARLPGLGEKLTILTEKGDRREIVFLGFDLNAVGEASLLIGLGGDRAIWPMRRSPSSGRS